MCFRPRVVGSALERKRTITSIPLSEERQILKQINGIKKSKTQVEEYNAYDKTVQGTKVCNVSHISEEGRSLHPSCLSLLLISGFRQLSFPHI